MKKKQENENLLFFIKQQDEFDPYYEEDWDDFYDEYYMDIFLKNSDILCKLFSLYSVFIRKSNINSLHLVYFFEKWLSAYLEKMDPEFSWIVPYTVFKEKMLKKYQLSHHDLD